MFSYSNIFQNKNKILFVTAHPDDVDVFFGGTLALLNKDQKEVHVLILTSGGRGSKNTAISEKELAKLRFKEEIESLRILGQDEEKVYCLEYLDGEIENSLEIIGKISFYLRKINPDLVCTMEPHGYYFKAIYPRSHYVNHRDHRNTGQSVIDSIYPFSRDQAFFKEQLIDDIKTCEIRDILFTGDYEKNTRIDITKVIDLKRKALLKHTSQFTPEIVEYIVNEGKKDNKYFEYFNYIKLGW